MRFQTRTYVASLFATLLIVGISITAYTTSQELENGYSAETDRLNDLKKVIRKRSEGLNQSAKEELISIINEETKSIRARIEMSEKTYERANHFILIDSGITLLLLWIGTLLLSRAMKSRLDTTASLRKASETLHKLVYSSPMGIYVLDLNLKVRLWNPSCEKIFGWESDEVVGEESPLVIEDLNLSTHKLVEEMIDKRAKIETQGTIHRKNGDRILVSTLAIPLLGQAERIEGYMFTLSDITEKYRIEQELRRAKDEALIASKTKSDFLAGMSHEIRTPLNGIIGMTDLLLETSLDEQQRLYSKIVQDSSNNLLEIVNDILDFSKIEAEKLELERIEFNLINLIESQAELMAPRAKEKNLSLMSYVDPKIPWSLIGDPGRLGQIFLNLIGNSIKFTQSGSIVIRAELMNTDKDFVDVKFSVTDSGIGISDEVKGKIFTPFTQADGSTARKFGGTGLGLSICKNLIQKMGGSINVTSVENQGSTFWFSIRLPISKSIEAINTRNALQNPQQEDGKILILAREPLEQQVLTRYMNDWKLKSEATGNAQIALEKLSMAKAQGIPFDIVLVDKNLEEDDGFAFAKKILATSELLQTKMILMTNFEKGVRLENSHSEGFTSYITKPVKQVSLYSLIQDTILRTKRIAETPQEIKPITVPIRNVKEGVRLILIVEDNRVNQLLTTKILDSLGYAFDVVNNGKEALLAIKKTKYDLILMDCHMPEMDGYEATAEIRKTERYSSQRIPIIALTASAMPEDRQRALESGMDDHLAKPIKKEQLGQMVARWTEKAAKAA